MNVIDYDDPNLAQDIFDAGFISMSEEEYCEWFKSYGGHLISVFHPHHNPPTYYISDGRTKKRCLARKIADSEHVVRDFRIRKDVLAHYRNKQKTEEGSILTDKVNPSHYKSGGMEVIDVIEAFKLDFKLANAIKYILRAGKKPGQTSHDDLKKAIWYINRHIEKEPNCHAMTINEMPNFTHRSIGKNL